MRMCISPCVLRIDPLCDKTMRYTVRAIMEVSLSQVFRHNLPNASAHFARSWSDYKRGFGGSGGNFWLGNDNLNRLTTQGANRAIGYMLRVVWHSVDRGLIRADYSGFSMGDANSNYALSLGAFLSSSTARK